MPTLKKKNKEPDGIRPYTFHGVSFDVQDGDEAVGDCPFCGRSGKFSVNVPTSKFRCLVCDCNGNGTSFVRQLHQVSLEETKPTDYQELAHEFGLHFVETPMEWQIAKSYITGQWMVPGWKADGQLKTLYLYGDLLYPTPTLGHGVHGINLFNKDAEEVHLCEGWKDGMCWYEYLCHMKLGEDGKYHETANREDAIIAGVNVLACAGTGSVGEPLKAYNALMADKYLTLLFDSDHPREHRGRMQEPAGLGAVRRASKILNSAYETFYLSWGEEGFDPDLKSGHDVRDSLCRPS